MMSFDVAPIVYCKCLGLFRAEYSSLTRFAPLVSFYALGKHLKASSYSGSIERDQWHEMGRTDIFISRFEHVLVRTNTSETHNQDF